MKAYKFRFENVLKSKKVIVDQLASKTARAQKILMLEEKKLEDLRRREERCIHAVALLQVGLVVADEVWRCHQHLEVLDAAIKEQTKRVREIARRVDMLRGMLVGAEKDRKVFEKLDEREREQFLREFLRKEQAVLDEVGLNGFVQRNIHGEIHSSQQRQ
jgi:flagellar FliJ protein